ncbi:MAG: menaquinone biosynthesis decarboxylase [Bacteroidales bacterium]|jgi:4-hydroxy-3-polyprenylbenzoate decarboxylase|nr:menaquinone biosynthesis decarboxylase [Bacteroidales bacterium]
MSIHRFISNLEQQGELCRIRQFVDPVLEIAEVTDRCCKQPGGGKALLFENTGTAFPVLTNAMGSDRRICSALGVTRLDEAAMLIEKLFKDITSPRKGWQNKIRLLSELRRVASWMPKTVKGRGACQEIVHHNPDLGILPILKCWPADGGRFVTLPMVHTKDPHTGIRNAGMYRMQVIDANTTGMHWHRHKTGARHYREYKALGKRMPVAVALGGDPAYIYSATAPLPDGVDEYILAGFLRRQKVRMVRCITQDMEVPEDADIVIEGYVDPAEDLFWEGPFGDHTGFYSLADRYPRFHVTCITHRKDAVYPATIVGIPPQEDAWLEKASECIFLAPIKLAMLPEVKDMNMPVPGVAHNLALVQIDKSYPGQGMKTIHSLWGAGQMMLNKILLVTDSPVDDYRKLAQQALTRINFHTDLVFGKGPLDVLDHSSPRFAFGSKLGIDATHKWPEETDSPDNRKSLLVSEDGDKNQKYSMVSAWNLDLLKENIPIAILAIRDPGTGIIAALGSHLLADEELRPVKVFILLDDTVDICDPDTVCWLACANIDPERDIRLAVAPRQQIVADACMKHPRNYEFPREWPNVVTASETTIRIIDQKWEQLGLGNFVSSPSVKFLEMKKGDGAAAL